MEAVVLEHLSKTYPGGKEAVRQVSLALGEGEVFGFLGPNGAGKTTTVKLLNGMLTPTAGSCRVLGSDPAREPEKVHARSGVVTEHAQMYDNLTGLQNLMFYASIFGMAEGQARGRANELLRQLGLEDAKDQKLSAYSTGMRQRLSLARALIHRPEALFLDEPTSGLDPESAKNVNRLIRRLAKEEGITVFLCTHQLRYAQEICTRYGLMEEGRLLAMGTLEELRRQVCPTITLSIRADQIPGELSFQRLTGQTPQETGSRAEADTSKLGMGAGENVGDPKGDDGKKGFPGSWVYETTIRSEEEIPGIVRQIVTAGGNIYSVAAQKPSLEEIYFALTGKGDMR